MTCEKAFDRYLSLDRNERVPFGVTLHLISCPACRTSVRKLTRAERMLSRPLAVQATAPSVFASGRETAIDPSVEALLARIASEGHSFESLCPAEPRISMYRWVVVGLALVAGFAIVPFSSIGIWTRLVFGNSFLIPFSLLCGVAVTLYCGLFIGSNIDFFVKKFGFHHTV
jgi:predicted anti-sigma-YlaC factor YlaD